ncbi:phosphate-starvation-inducible PsiE family protein [Methylotenera sp.]|uniref:phosphate-starvation-inducible PsiE family protein n=1 Tax=Methylotenera sp. TaxID=2051956 RepID=UPI00271F162F|nr:phosphate-starvation-inducible PsiE family protein [Methylotenera sp.]MDO9393078.1 phosphate-starvation-inducible PsiE family protein [Methylotenera sp.]MDP1522112.1 phosphate-starvation-inducible PsiE family protein [Methylotenera sp.]MDP2072339.1 phosphate-starvation-inducible PsiE family protein [Methylotenera sp.]MDP2231094.1 phosphate-starvation-inducible PsiE family protein [Methylotenera sp.]MDP3005138.1 phosphate-starvation-inducible PsiE family protein [Methylotenera sp.]
MSQDQLPEEFAPINRIAIKAMLWLNGFAHIVIGLALATSVIMFTWLFFKDVQQAAYAHNLVHGFLHALGTLMLLWSISALISAEIRYLNGSKLAVETFIEVVLVLFLRKLIVMPVQDVTPSIEEISIWIGGAFMMGLLYVLIRWAQKQPTA